MHTDYGLFRLQHKMISRRDVKCQSWASSTRVPGACSRHQVTSYLCRPDYEHFNVNCEREKRRILSSVSFIHQGTYMCSEHVLPDDTCWWCHYWAQARLLTGCVRSKSRAQLCKSWQWTNWRPTIQTSWSFPSRLQSLLTYLNKFKWLQFDSTASCRTT